MALPYPAPGGEDDIRLVAVLHVGKALDAQTLADWLEERMPRFMLPRYIEFTDSLPRNPASKVEKYKLVNRGLAADVWNREAGTTSRPARER